MFGSVSNQMLVSLWTSKLYKSFRRFLEDVEGSLEVEALVLTSGQPY